VPHLYKDYIKSTKHIILQELLTSLPDV